MAMTWYVRAVDEGLAQAAVNVARLLFEGGGVEQDLCAAVQWLRRAAQLGETGAEEQLATLDMAALDCTHI